MWFYIYVLSPLLTQYSLIILRQHIHTCLFPLFLPLLEMPEIFEIYLKIPFEYQGPIFCNKTGLETNKNTVHWVSRDLSSIKNIVRSEVRMVTSVEQPPVQSPHTWSH